MDEPLRLGRSEIRVEQLQNDQPAGSRKMGPRITIRSALKSAFSDGGHILFNTTLATAIADRWVENSEIFLLAGESLRKAQKSPPLSSS
jgi:hypothetical protein